MVESGKIPVSRAGIRLTAVAAGWEAAFICGLISTTVLWALYAAAAGSAERSELSAGVVALCLVGGFLAHLAGGALAARLAAEKGGLHGALTSAVGLAAGAILAPTLAVYGQTLLIGVAAPPVSFGVTVVALLSGVLLFGANLLGGYVGGRLVELAGERY